MRVRITTKQTDVFMREYVMDVPDDYSDDQIKSSWYARSDMELMPVKETLVDCEVNTFEFEKVPDPC